MKTKHFIIFVSIFVVLFVALATVSAIYDLQINNEFADLEKGEYYSNNLFGYAMHVFSEIPIYLFLCYAFSVIFWNAFYFGKPVYKWSICIVALIAIIVVGFVIPNRIHGNYNEYNGINEDVAPSGIVLDVLVGLCISALALAGVMFTGKGRIKRQLAFAVIILFVALVSQVFAQGMKFINKRARYCAMNAVNDFSYYTPWYVYGIPEEFKALTEQFGTDAIKSFPSGHTAAAGTIFSLIAIPYVFRRFSDLGGKILFHVIGFLFTAVVGYSRMIIGAHFFSDVLFSLGISYLSAVVVVWIVFGLKAIKPLTAYCQEGVSANGED